MGSSGIGVGAFSMISWLVVLLGGLGSPLPLSVPPLPEETMMANIAPEECLGYLSSVGMATPDAKSTNQTELLFAEPEVRQMAAEIERAVKSGLKQSLPQDTLPPGVTSGDIADAIKLVLTRPLAVYVSSIQMQPSGPAIRGGIVVDCGKDAPKLRATLEQLTRIAPPQLITETDVEGEKWKSFAGNPELGLVFGFHNNCFIVTLGKDEAKALMKRATAQPPAWLAKLRQDLPVERLSTVTYINLKAVKKLALPMAGPQAAGILTALGLDNATSLASVTGLDQKGFVSKTLVGIDGTATGVLALADTKPLTPTDLAPIPRDATFAVAFKLNPEKTIDTILGIFDRIDPRAKNDILRDINGMKSDLGLSLRDDILKPLGDTWRIFDSPSEGGVLTGLIVVVSLNNPKQAAATNATLVKAIQSRLAKAGKRLPLDEDSSREMGPRMTVLKFAGSDINTFDSGPIGAPVTPAWCITDKELIVSLHPQSIKAYLSRNADFESLANVPEVAQSFQGDAGPIKLAYGNTQRVFDVLYPAILTFSKYLSLASQQTGVNLSPAMLPSARAIRPHLAPTVMAVRRTKAGIEVVEQRTLPSASLATTVPVGVGLLVPAIQSSRSTGGQEQSLNNMKQIGLALLNYEAAQGRFPPAYRASKNGKPLLSWRVLILPFFDEDALYRQFHLDEPWDSEHNKKLISKMPAVYKCPTSSVSGQGKTNYLTVRGKNTIFSGPNGTRIAEVTDGTSNTIMTVEVSDTRAVIWTKPDDFEYDEQDPLIGLGGVQGGTFIVGFADGAVELLPSSITPQVLKSLFTRSTGESVDRNNLAR